MTKATSYVEKHPDAAGRPSGWSRNDAASATPPKVASRNAAELLDHVPIGQGADLVRVQAKLAKHLRGVLAEIGRRTPQPRWSV